VLFFCGNNRIACSIREAESCTIIIVTDEHALASVGTTYDVVLRHEIGHCNGWTTPDHADARYLPGAEPVILPVRKPPN
jgi:hypothetical protein